MNDDHSLKSNQHNNDNPSLPISPEYDMIRKNYFSQENIDRSQWIEQLFSSFPEIKDFFERIMPLNRAVEFGKLYLPNERLIDQGMLFSFISHHLHILGLLDSQQSLQEEWECDQDFTTKLDKSQLALLIQRGIQNAENFWLLTTPGTSPKNCSEDELQRKVFEEFEKILGKEVPSFSIIRDTSPLAFELPNDSEKIVVDQNGKLKFSSLNQLIWISTTENKFQSKQLTEALALLSSTLSKNPSVMFSKIRERFRIALEKETFFHNSENSESNHISSPHHISDNQLKELKLTLKLLSCWIDQISIQLSPSVISSIQLFLKNEVPKTFSEKVVKIQSKIQRIIRKQKIELYGFEEEDYQDDIEFDSPPPKVELNSHCMSWAPNFELTSLPPIEFARQLTIFIWRQYNKIERCELVYIFDDEIERNQPNLNPLITKCNNFFRWIQFYILSKNELNERAQFLGYFIKVAKKLFQIQNFYGCSLILNAFDNAFSFLKETKNLISKDDLNFVEKTKSQIVDFSSDSKTVQEFFHAALLKMPTIPVLFPYKSAIQSAIKGSLVEKSLVNVPVLLEITKLVGEFEEFQKKKFCFYAIDQAQDLLEKCNSPKTLNELIDYAKKLE